MAESKKEEEKKEKKDKSHASRSTKKTSADDVLDLTIEQVQRKYGRGALLLNGEKE